MSLDDKAWQTSVFKTHLGLVAVPLLPSPAPPLLLSPLPFITPTRATRPSSPSTAPIHQRAAITCRSALIDDPARPDVAAYQSLRRRQIQSLCLFMILWVLSCINVLVFITIQVLVTWYKTFFLYSVLSSMLKRFVVEVGLLCEYLKNTKMCLFIRQNPEVWFLTENGTFSLRLILVNFL